MDTETFTLFFSLLALGGMASVVGVLCLAIAATIGGSGGARRLLGELADLGVVFAMVATGTAMAGSLYYSEVAGFDPCRLCVIQRFFMYPAAFFLLVALVVRGAARRSLSIVALVWCVIGFGVAIYHRLEQQFPDSVGGTCALDNPCSGRYVNQFDWITIPTMAATAFAIAIAFLSLTLLASDPSGSQPRSTPVS